MSITKVARKARVSVATVSRVLNRRSSVQPDLARRVRQAMVDVGYEPRAVRPGPKPRRARRNEGTGALGVLIRGRSESHLLLPYMNRLFLGLTAEAERCGYQPMVMALPDGDGIPRAVREQQVDGLIFLSGVPISDQSVTDRFHPLPCIHVGGVPLTLPVMDHVLADNRAAGVLAADYLWSRGCRRPAYLDHVPQHKAFPLRWAAFRERLAERGIEPGYAVSSSCRSDEAKQWEPQDVKSQLDELLTRLLAERPDVDGIFLPTDQQSATCHTLLKQRGIMPEKDVALVSCNNDEPWLITMDPRPATVDMRPDEQGRQCVRRLLERMEDPTASPVVVLTTPTLVLPSALRGGR